MYEILKQWLLKLVKVPAQPLDPMGDATSVRMFRASPGYLRYLTVGWLALQLIPTGLTLAGLVAASMALVAHEPHASTKMVLIIVSPLLVLAYLIQATFSYVCMRLSFEMRWYKVTDRSLRIRWGIMTVHEMTVTFANIQNITITQGPLERLFGISDVRVQTAGGGDGGKHRNTSEGRNGDLHAGVFRGVDDPEVIRDLITQHLRRLRDAGLGDPDELSDTKEALAPVSGFGDSRETVEALCAFRNEARALRQAAEAALAARRRG
ncbi:MAG: PH domain-containing protein [Planctomycetes bacterium]|nr:PH domain-containing protein [Planctomycetota bacterium]